MKQVTGVALRLLRMLAARRPSSTRRVLRGLERVAFGGHARERLLSRALLAHYRSLFRRKWGWFPPEEGPPHFFDHRIGAVEFALSGAPPFGWARGFHALEIIRQGDSLLDLGCGDGFFARRFFAPRCSRVDAVDVEPSAIAHALEHNAAPNVRYHVLDAVAESFPEPPYDVIVWDGALGHFSPDTTVGVLEKVRAALAPAGVLVGSESLGTEGTDHLQFFHSLDDLGGVLRPHFAHVELKRVGYRVGDEGACREEGLWRCAGDPARLDDGRWRS